MAAVKNGFYKVPKHKDLPLSEVFEMQSDKKAVSIIFEDHIESGSIAIFVRRALPPVTEPLREAISEDLFNQKFAEAINILNIK